MPRPRAGPPARARRSSRSSTTPPSSTSASARPRSWRCSSSRSSSPSRSCSGASSASRWSISPHRSPLLSWLTATLVAAGALTAVFPFVWIGLTSLKTAPEIQRVPLQLSPDRWSNAENYREVFRRRFARFLVNSALLATVSATSSLVVSALAGYGFAKFRFPGRDVFFFAIVGILMVPFQSVVVPLCLWANRLGLLDTYLGILAPDLVSVFGVFLMRQAIEAVPDDYLAAARIDGCNEWAVFWRVVVPAVAPALATLAIIKFMWTWNEFFWPLVVVNSPAMKTVTLGLIGFTNMYFIEYNLVTAAAVLSVLPILIIFLVLQKWVVQAAVMTGLKG